MRISFVVLLIYLFELQTVVFAEETETLVPVIIEHPIDVVVSRGSPATLNCAAKPPGAKITWFKDGQPVTTNKQQVNSHRIVLDTGALFLLKVNSGKNGKDGDAGAYYCVATNEHGEAKSNEGSLKLAMLRDDFRTRPRTVQALAGEKAVLECSPPRGFPEPVVSWRKDDKEIRISDLPRYTLHPDGNLIIEPVSHEDSGTFQCVASNMVGEKVSSPARLSVYEKPKFLQEPKDMTVDVGASVLFDCRVAGEPMPQITWKRKNDQMPIARAYIAKDNRGLRIDRVQATDEGEYVCYARNPAGQIEASAHLRVQAPPTFQTKPVDQSVPAGGSAHFECVLVGQPIPAYFWSKEGHQDLLFPSYVSADGRMKVSASGTLTIEDVRPVDEGAYVCAGMNAAGSSLSKALLKVTTKAATGNSPARPPPIIEHGHQNQTLPVGSSAILPCQASGKPVPRISWTRENELLDMKDNRYSQHSTGSLHIAELRKSDTGVYTCRAKNDEGESTWSAPLFVEDHTSTAAIIRMLDPSHFPGAPSQPTIVNVTDKEVELEWKAPSNTGPTPIVGYFIQYYSPDIGQTWYNIPDVVTTTTFRVKGLQPSHSYMFLTRAENEKGIGPPSVPSALVTTMAKPPDDGSGNRDDVDIERAAKRLTSEQLIKLEEVKTINSTAVRLFWKRRKVEDLVDGYYIKWRGPPRAQNDQYVNVTGAATESYVVGGLLPFINYEFFVIPYHRSLKRLHQCHQRMYTSECSILQLFAFLGRRQKAEGINGILKGFQIVIMGKDQKNNRNITTNERAASVTLFHLVPNMAYKIRVASRSNAGVGVAHGTDTIVMNQETLEKHLAQNEPESFLFSFLNRSMYPVVILVALILIIIVIIVAFFVLRSTRKADGKDHDFIKINDGGVHQLSGSSFWDPAVMYGNNGHLTLNNRNGGHALYSLTPNAQDFYARGDYNGTTRSTQDHQYHYAQLVGGPANPLSTFNGNQYHDDPSPYAMTTLTMSNQQPAWMSESAMHGPTIPTNPIPNAPPARYADHTTGRRSRSSRTSDGRATINGGIHTNGSQRSDSPPHTDVSYVQLHSSDGTNGSIKDRGRRTPPRQTLMDFIPPPPSGPPPPSIYDAAFRRQLNRSGTPRDDTYDCVTDNAVFGVNGRPTSRNRTNGIRPQKGNRDDDSQRSSLMMDDDGASSEADAEVSDTDMPKARKSVPRMGVSASALNQGSNTSGRRSGPAVQDFEDSGRSTSSRFKTAPRGLKQDQL
ncbi:unnamed protein product [Caenorhabditis auriculariae]|uniref:Uncharacterized protein n=1 Tax=Caenorhabditis auriculariae TaxID=2777116 RepID=A0A8S1H588_9PELO|nr:unnamed protein product [Caenorhabditis auriculariae]